MNMIADYLHRNGVIAERARREGRSLSHMERQILKSGLDAAQAKGLGRKRINELIMIGERDWDHVLAPLKVVVKFAYYNEPFEDIPANADYLILSSNHPELPAGGNVSVETLKAHDVKVPKTPTYEEWVKKGRPCFRGGQS